MLQTLTEQMTQSEIDNAEELFKEILKKED